MTSQLPIPPVSDDAVLAEDEYIEIPEWHFEMLDERLARYEKFGMQGTPLEEFEKELADFLEELKNR